MTLAEKAGGSIPILAGLAWAEFHKLKAAGKFKLKLPVAGIKIADVSGIVYELLELIFGPPAT